MFTSLTKRNAMQISTILNLLTSHKAKDIKILDVTNQTPLMDTMIVCTATSNRHARSLAELLIKFVKAQFGLPVGVEGLDLGEWILVDLGDIVAHIMLLERREFYQIDTLWVTSEEKNYLPTPERV